MGNSEGFITKKRALSAECEAMLSENLFKNYKGADLNKLNTSFYKVIQCFTFQHIILQQGKIN